MNNIFQKYLKGKKKTFFNPATPFLLLLFHPVWVSPTDCCTQISVCVRAHVPSRGRQTPFHRKRIRGVASVFETYASAFMRSACRKRSAVISTITLGFRIKSKPKKKTPISKRTIHRGKRVYSRDGHYFRVYPVVARTAETSRPDHRFRRSCRPPSTVANDFYAVTEEKSKLFAERAEFPGPTGKTSRTRSARVVRSSKIYRKSLGGGARTTRESRRFLRLVDGVGRACRLAGEQPRRHPIVDTR